MNDSELERKRPTLEELYAWFDKTQKYANMYYRAKGEPKETDYFCAICGLMPKLMKEDIKALIAAQVREALASYDQKLNELNRLEGNTPGGVDDYFNRKQALIDEVAQRWEKGKG